MEALHAILELKMHILPYNIFQEENSLHQRALFSKYVSLFGKNIILYSLNPLKTSELMSIPSVDLNVGSPNNNRHLLRFWLYFGIWFKHV